MLWPHPQPRPLVTSEAAPTSQPPQMAVTAPSTVSSGGGETGNTAVQVGTTFTEFFADREVEKRSLYEKVVFYGGLSLLISAVPLLIGGSLLGGSDQAVNILAQVLAVIGAFGFSASLCAASTVPVTEFDIEDQLNERPYVRAFVGIVVGAVALTAGTLVSCLPPYFPSIPLALAGLWIATHELQFDRWPLLLKLSVGILLALVCVAHVFLSQVLLPAQMATNVTGLLTEFSATLLINPYKQQVFLIVLAIQSTIILLGVCYTAQRGVQKIMKEEPQAGWATSIFFSTLYLCLTVLGTGYLTNGLGTALTSGLFLSRLFGYVLCTIVFLAPPVFLFFFGKERAFSLLAVYFEFDLKRQQQDGALMAHLVSESSSKLHKRHKLELFSKQLKEPSTFAPVWWVKRVNEDKSLISKDPNHIKRCFWAKGVIESSEKKELQPASASSFAIYGQRMIVQVDMRNDIDPSWAAFYVTKEVNSASPNDIRAKETELMFQPPTDQGALQGGAAHFPEKPFPDAKAYEQWREINFGGTTSTLLEPPKLDDTFEAWKQRHTATGSKNAVPAAKATSGIVVIDQSNVNEYFSSNPSRVAQDHEARRITLVITVPLPDNSIEYMMEWATDDDNFRSFGWEGRTLDIFSLSPRQLNSKVEKDLLFSRSHPKVIASNADKLDYFVSHSWEYNGEDTGQNKYNKVKAFMEKERASRGHYPTLWLDKVCINQNDTSQAISVLPIIIGGCKQVLILLSPTYLTRLWCVWELFTLFTFCNKELALQRVVVLPLVDFKEQSTAAPSGGEGNEQLLFSALKDFDIDNAHCFDPNEELKLRQVICEIGSDKLGEAFKKLSGKFSEAVAQMRKEAGEKVAALESKKTAEIAEAGRKERERAQAAERRRLREEHSTKKNR